MVVQTETMLLLNRLYPRGVPGPHHLAAEGLVAALGGTLFGWWAFPAEVSLVAVFLAAITSADSSEQLLEDNRRAILDEGVRPLRANARLVWLVLALFAGQLLGFSLVALFVPLPAASAMFGHQLADTGGTTFPDLAFAPPAALLLNNLYVLIFFFVIAVLFRQGGVMLAVAWNASVWGATFGVLARRWSEHGGPGPIEAGLRVVAATAPHLALEAVAYVMAGFAGVFLSKAMAKYAVDSPILASVTRTALVMLLAGAVVVGVGALWEGLVAEILVRALS